MSSSVIRMSSLTLAMIVCSPLFGRLNVLLITADDLGLQLGCYQDPVAQTPELDRLAAESTRFRVAYVAQSSCSPSRSAMFTGLFPHTNGQIALASSGYALKSRYRSQTIPNLLKRAGYRTGLIGKLHVNPESSFQWDYRNASHVRRMREVQKSADRFIASGTEPFFLMVNFSDPHWERSTSGGPWIYRDQIDGIPEHVLQAKDVQPFPFQGFSSPKHLDRIAGYYNAVHRLDAGVGMLLDSLRQAGHAHNTLVIFVGDHGPPFVRAKTTCYEAGLRVPFLVSWPGVSKRSASSALVSTVDILPTILDAADVSVPQGLHGKSLRQVVSGNIQGWRRYLPAEFHSHGLSIFYPRRAIRDDRYKLIHNLRPGQPLQRAIDGDPGFREVQGSRHIPETFRAAYERFEQPPEWELFDLSADPWELTNLADEASMQSIRTRLQRALAGWRNASHDPLLRPAYMVSLEANAKSGQVPPSFNN